MRLSRTSALSVTRALKFNRSSWRMQGAAMSTSAAPVLHGGLFQSQTTYMAAIVGAGGGMFLLQEHEQLQKSFAPSSTPAEPRLPARDTLDADLFNKLRTARSLTNINSPSVAQGPFNNYLNILKVPDDEARRTALWAQLGPNHQGKIRAQDFMLATVVLAKTDRPGMAAGLVELAGDAGTVDGHTVERLFCMMARLGRIEMAEAEAAVAAAQFVLQQGRGGRVGQRELAEGLAGISMRD